MLAHLQEEEDSPGERVATPRLVLRPPTKADVQALVSLADNVAIAEHLASMPHPYGPEDAAAWIDRAAAMPDAKGRNYVVCLADADAGERLIGCAGWGPVEGIDLPQIGYWIGEPFWGNGYATEAAHAVIDDAFTRSTFDRIGAGCRVTNAASRRVIEKSGFQYEGLGMIHSRYHGGSLPVLKFQLDRTAWASLKAWGAAGTANASAAG